MDAVTYPAQEVANLLNERFVPVHLQIDKHPDEARRLGAVWTPGLMCLDAECHIRRQTYGYLPPGELQAFLHLCEGHFHLAAERYPAAEQSFDRVIAHFTHAPYAPEALYWKAVCRYRQEDKDGLVAAWTRLKNEYPSSEWHLKSAFIF